MKSVCIACLSTLFGVSAVFGEDLQADADTEINVPAGEMVEYDIVYGGYTFTKTGAGTLKIRMFASNAAKLDIREGDVEIANEYPASVFAQAQFHVDASDLSTMTLVEENGTNFVTRWNDKDGRTDMYATPNQDAWQPSGYANVLRTDPEKRLPFISET